TRTEELLMLSRLTLSCALLLTVPAVALAEEEGKWEQKAESDGVVVYTRERKGTDVKEVKAVGVIDAPPQQVFRVLADYERYKEIMPYTDESKVVATEQEGKVVHFYSLINAPFVSKRDYTLRIVDQSDWKDGAGYLKSYWTSSDKGPPPKDGVVRVQKNEGSWHLEPLDGGKKTRANYWVFTDPGGSLPTFIVNKANSSAIPDVYKALRKHSKEARYADKK
ncbi:MAG: START domain-containing protein, partial [Myxococcales bacterium]